MNEIERVAWLIDPEAFSEDTRQWERSNPGASSFWMIRRTKAKKKARVIIALLREGS